MSAQETHKLFQLAHDMLNGHILSREVMSLELCFHLEHLQMALQFHMRE